MSSMFFNFDFSDGDVVKFCPWTHWNNSLDEFNKLPKKFFLSRKNAAICFLKSKR